MGERYRCRSDWQPSSLRMLLAGLLGHYAAACSFCAVAMLVRASADFHAQGFSMFAGATLGRAFEVISTTPALICLVGLWGAVLISPTLLFTLPATVWAALKLDTNGPSTVAIGVLPGILAGLAVFGSAPRIQASIIACSAAGGAGFALVIWLLCIRPRRYRGRDPGPTGQGVAA